MRRTLLVLSTLVGLPACTPAAPTPTLVYNNSANTGTAGTSSGYCDAQAESSTFRDDDGRVYVCKNHEWVLADSQLGRESSDDARDQSSDATPDSGENSTVLNTSTATDSSSALTGPGPIEFVESRYPSRTIDGGSVGACHEFSQSWVQFNKISFNMGSAGPGGDTITYWLETARDRNFAVTSMTEISVGDLVITDANTADLVTVHVAVVAKVLGRGQVQLAEASYYGFNTVSTDRVFSIDESFFGNTLSQGVISLAKLRAGGGI